MKYFMFLFLSYSAIFFSFSQEAKTNVIFKCDSTQTQFFLTKVDSTYYFHNEDYPLISIIDPQRIESLNIISLKESDEIKGDPVISKYKSRLGDRVVIIKSKKKKPKQRN